MSGHQTEPSANTALAGLLNGMMSGCLVRAEHTRLVAGHAGLQLDIAITAPDRAPVALEAEYFPARNVEAEAASRLGLPVVHESTPIEAAIALRYPHALASADDLRAAIAGATLSWCVFSQNEQDTQRFPAAGWLTGSVADLADLIRLVSIPQHAVDAAASALEDGIDAGVSILHDMAEQRPAIAPAIARLLGMADVAQTRRMACAILANALIFHERLAGMYPEVKPLHLVCGQTNPQDEILTAWTAILDINYWPIFAIARDIVAQLPPATAAPLLDALRHTAEGVASTGTTNAHDLTGRIFQRLIADRKYLATFYTLPASAALLARLAVAKLRGLDWADPAAIGRLRIADFACGTGALLSAVYEQIASRHERTGGNPADLHPVMMEEVLYGCDVMPSAIHITGSTLSGVQPQASFGSSRLYTLAYGRQPDASVKIGSLELLHSTRQLVLLNTSDPAKRTGSLGEETATHILADIPDEGFDLVIMNPPFTSNTKHYDANAGVLNAAFAAFDTSRAEQDSMAARLKEQAKNTCYHGHAGLASAFAGLADRKTRPGGVVALVLPFTAINGSSWAKFRQTIASHYLDVTIVSIAANGMDMSFSSDTGMAECLIIGRKLRPQENPDRRASFVSLRRRPGGFAHALELSKGLPSDVQPRHLEAGPYGGLPIHCGDEPVGEILTAPIASYDNGWGAARILDAAVAQTAHALSSGKLWLPAEPKAIALPIAPLRHVGQRGLDSQLFISTAHNGPFTLAEASPTATYPALWNHDAKKETRMVCEPDSALQVRPGMEARAAEVWATASRVHISRGFRFNSQALAITTTEQRSLGGRAWPNVRFDDEAFDYAFAVWGNSTLGLLSYWWHSSRQQGGRGEITIRSAETLPVLDFRALSPAQLATARAIFDEFRTTALLPAHLAAADPNRARLDRGVVRDLLGFTEATYEAVRRLAAKWCAEPSVHGGKGRV